MDSRRGIRWRREATRVGPSADHAPNVCLYHLAETAFTSRADQEGWPAARLLAALSQHEVADRARRRIERHLGEARLPPRKTLENFDYGRAHFSAAQCFWVCWYVGEGDGRAS